MKGFHLQLKPMVSEVEKLDKEFKLATEKVEKAREKYIKAAKEFEEIILNVQTLEWCKDTPVH